MSTRTVERVRALRAWDDLPPASRWLLTLIAEQFDDEAGEAVIGRADLARQYGSSSKALFEHVDRLRDRGVLVVVRVKGRHTRYLIPGVTHPARLQEVAEVVGGRTTSVVGAPATSGPAEVVGAPTTSGPEVVGAPATSVRVTHPFPQTPNPHTNRDTLLSLRLRRGASSLRSVASAGDDNESTYLASRPA